MPYKVETASVRWRKNQPTVVRDSWEVESSNDKSSKDKSSKDKSSKDKIRAKARKKKKSKLLGSSKAKGIKGIDPLRVLLKMGRY